MVSSSEQKILLIVESYGVSVTNYTPTSELYRSIFLMSGYITDLMSGRNDVMSSARILRDTLVLHDKVDQVAIW